MRFDAHFHPFARGRAPVFGDRGMVATSQSLAAQAGLHILRSGGNAIDAAVAAAACLTVVEPTSNGIGGDAFALVWAGGKLYGLNASGPAPRALSLETVRESGHSAMPTRGFFPVTVPGAPAAWAALLKRFGRLSLEEVMQPAIAYAQEGYAVPATLSLYWNRAAKAYRPHADDPAFADFFRVFFPGGRAPAAGERWASPDHARTLREIAATGAESFYRGDLAEAIHAFHESFGGFMTREDLAAFAPEWVEPIRVRYRGYDVWELPPNGQGLVALQALGMLDGFDVSDRDGIETIHRQIEAVKLAFADGRAHITDPRFMTVSVDELLSADYLRARRALISDQAIDPFPGKPRSEGTVYLATADGDGNMVSMIQSNYAGFGSGLVVPGTGIALQNRGSGFSLEEGHANRLEPGKRTYHTIIPGFLTQAETPLGPFGVMGGFMQPQGHVQVLMNAIDFQLHPQAALDRPRWQWTEGRRIEVEPEYSAALAQALSRRGHDVRIAADSGGFGRGQIIWRNPHGVLVGGTDPRADGVVAAW